MKVTNRKGSCKVLWEQFQLQQLQRGTFAKTFLLLLFFCSAIQWPALLSSGEQQTREPETFIVLLHKTQLQSSLNPDAFTVLGGETYFCHYLYIMHRVATDFSFSKSYYFSFSDILVKPFTINFQQIFQLSFRKLDLGKKSGNDSLHSINNMCDRSCKWTALKGTVEEF